VKVARIGSVDWMIGEAWVFFLGNMSEKIVESVEMPR